MRTGKDRVTVDAVQTAVQIGGVSAEPGDVVIGDGDGIVVLPRNRLLEVVELAESIESTENLIRMAVQAGERLDVARRRLGYHLLQRQGGGNSTINLNRDQR
jgi:regulator of RNase E activity RraA